MILHSFVALFVARERGEKGKEISFFTIERMSVKKLRV